MFGRAKFVNDSNFPQAETAWLSSYSKKIGSFYSKIRVSRTGLKAFYRKIAVFLAFALVNMDNQHCP